MADHDQQRLIELDGNENPKVVFKVSSFFCELYNVYLQKKIIPTPWKVPLEILMGRRVLRAEILEATSEDKPEFPGRKPGGGGCKAKKTSTGGVWLFSGTAQLDVNT